MQRGRLLRHAAIAIVAVLASGLATAADSRPANAVTIERTAIPPAIDGRLDDPVWRDVIPIRDFHQQAPDYRAPPSEETEVRVSYDDHYFYIGAKLLDREPEKIVATQLIQREDISADDRFWCTLDTFNSKRNDYSFTVNPNGVRSDALRENNSNAISEWNTIWNAASRIDADGWTTEMAIPFKSLSFSSTGGIWRINCGRYIVRKQEHVLLESSNRQWWAVDSRELYGISGLRQGLGLDVSTSATVASRRDFDTGRKQTEIQPSVDVYYRLTPSITGAATFNSDFSTAEVDDVQVALDRFSLFFPEKRDFFLQDAGIFEFGGLATNGRPFFSRKIGLAGDGSSVTLDAGGKLTGRTERLKFGALAVQQEDVGGTGSKLLAVARGSINVLEESALGFIATHGDPLSHRSNSLYGADFHYRTRTGPFGGTLQGSLWLQRTRTPGLDDQDLAAGATLAFPNDRVNWSTSLQEIQANFNPALGFVNRRGIRQYDGTFRYRTRPQALPLREIDQQVQLSRVTGVDGNRQSQIVRVRPVRLANRANDSVYIEWQRSQELVAQDFMLFRRLRVPAADYSFDQVRIELATGVQRPIALTASLQDGRFFGGNRLATAIDVRWRPSMHFYLRLGYTENDVSLPSGDFTSRLVRLQSDIAMNARWSLSSLVQYDNTADVVASSMRLRYQPRDGQEMLLVVNSAFDVDPDYRFSSAQSEALLKLSYTFRF